MAQEFQESELIFSDRDYCRYLHSDDDGGGEGYFICPRGMVSSTAVRDGGRKQLKNKEMASSLPVGIPEIFGRRTAEEDDEMNDVEMIPPHEVVERRLAGKTAFSVCTGNGRTLKGRDLSRVRNSILRMTGFLET